MSNRALRRAAISEARRRQSWDWRELSIDPALLARYPAVQRVRMIARNDFYIVQVFDVVTTIGVVTHLAIRGIDDHREPPWRDMQRIKNELVGETLEAVHVCPRQTDLVDQADMYHLFVLPAGYDLPFGLHRENGFVRRGA